MMVNTERTEFEFDSTVRVRPEYRNDPKLRGNYRGIVMGSFLVGTALVYRVMFDGFTLQITHGALELDN